jgi:hypothetical protein
VSASAIIAGHRGTLPPLIVAGVALDRVLEPDHERLQVPEAFREPLEMSVLPLRRHFNLRGGCGTT